MKFLRTILPVLILAGVFLFVPKEVKAVCEGQVGIRIISGANTVSDDWYDDENQPFVYLDVATSGCNGYSVVPFLVDGLDLIENPLSYNFAPVYSVVASDVGYFMPPSESEALPDIFETYPLGNDESYYFKINSTLDVPNPSIEVSPPQGEIVVPNDFTIVLKAGEDACNKTDVWIISNSDCNYGVLLLAWKEVENSSECDAIGGAYGVYGDPNDCVVTLDVNGGVYLLGAEYGEWWGLNAVVPDFIDDMNTMCSSLEAANSATKEFLKEFICGQGYSNQAEPFWVYGPGLFYECDYLCFGENWLYVSTQDFGYVDPNDNGLASTNTSGLPEIYEENYSPLAPLPFDGLNGSNITVGGYLTGIFQLMLIVAGVGALVMIIAGGMQILSADSIGSKSAGRAKLKNALLGLALVLGSYAILNTFNPDLVGNLSLGIPIIQVDAPSEEWLGGEAADGTPICRKGDHKLAGQPITMGMPWPSDAPQRSILASAGLSVDSSGGPDANCEPTAGTNHCTSVYFEGKASSVPEKLVELKQACDEAVGSACEIIVTGGSECWMHTTHGPEKRIVDLSVTPTLNQFITGSTTFPADGKNHSVSGFGQFKAEYEGQYDQTEGEHWHVKLQN